ncbi:MAG: hypothetical protein DRP11_02070 [Candidatus Aenigmatarchaeota archaeon]|nr:MAG: hypothetical protein DRP11_02070 [Candidatus Aenigmarchaeota archaeon]
MVNIFLFLSLIFLLTFIFGRFLERARVPWLFSALLLGAVLAIQNPFQTVTDSPTFSFLAQLGMYLLLFIIGFEMDIKKMRRNSRFIFKATFFIILLEALFGSILVRFLFGYDWIISILVALSFATIGEAILIPILDEFGITRTSFGQTIIGIGTLDDIIEVFVIILAIVLIGSGSGAGVNLPTMLFSLLVIFLLSAGMIKLKKEGRRFNFPNIEMLFLFVLFVLLLYIGIGEYGDAAPLAALLSGIALRTFVPKERLTLIESEIKTMCYGFFAPVFFLWVGVDMDMGYLFTYPLLILLVVLVSIGAKILGSYIISVKRFKKKKSILMGLGLSVRFSTSIIVIRMLLDSGKIGSDLYSVIVASSIIPMFVIPFLFSHLLIRWVIKD